jgi:predicted nucleic acid-binding protein
MRYLLDTNVLSELTKRPPEPKVAAWVSDQSPVDLFASVLTIGEITKGIASMGDGRRRDELRAWATQDLARMFFGRLLAVDEAVAREWGRIAAEGKRAGRPTDVVDGLLIATASVHGLVLVTRNERDCIDRGVPVLNPWR